VAAPGDEELKPSGDFELDELRRLAVKAPIEELIQHRKTFMLFLGRTYRRDTVLWKGVERLAQYLLNNPTYAERRIAAATLAQVIERGDPDRNQLVLHYVSELRKIR
jgi:hypothetical protein